MLPRRFQTLPYQAGSVVAEVLAHMTDEAFYDEFGEYIGPAIDDEEEDDAMEAAFNASAARAIGASVGDMDSVSDEEKNEARAASTAVVLHEDKKYYPEAEEVYGRDVEAMVQDEDTMPIEQPIIQPIKEKQFDLVEANAPVVNYKKPFLLGLMETPALIRNIALVGQMHCGKTSFIDTLVRETHKFPDSHEFERFWAGARQPRFCDSRIDEQKRGISIKSHPIAFVLSSSNGKSYLLNVIDTPGHVNFSDESTSALRGCDGAVVCVDAVEGLMLSTQRSIRYCLLEGIPMLLNITKIDRLVIELKLPPADAFFKLRHVIDEVNSFVRTCPSHEGFVFAPELGNVLFASPTYGFSFTLQSFALKYLRAANSEKVDHVRFASKLWGDSYFNASSRTFQQRPATTDAPRSFVEFILEPMYKIITCVLGEAAVDVKHTLAQVKVFLKSSLYSLDAKPLLRIALSAFFESSSGFVDAVVQHLPSPISGAARRVSRYYTGDQTSAAAASMRACSADGVLAMNVFKLYHTADCSVFDVLAYVVSGRVYKGTSVKVLGEAYTLLDEEDCATAVVQGISVPCGRYKVDVDCAGPGNIILLSGIDAPVLKSATVTSPVGSDGICTFLPIRHNTISTVRLAIEPLNPAELPRMLDGLRRVSKSYPLLRTKVEESGEHVIVGTGELYMDCVMHDLRLMYAEIEVKTADPCVSFCETIVETSSLKCFAETPNKKNKLTMIAEPLDKGLSEAIESGSLSLGLGSKLLAHQLQSNFNWDLLAARSVWAFGPEEKGCNVLLDDTLPSEVDKKLLSTVRSSVVQGFQWGCREGPLCDEPIRNVKFRLIDASIDATPLHRGGGQIIPTARRVAYSAFLMATPRLMEPVYHVEITSPADCVTAIFNVISRRRGMIVKEFPKAGTPLYVAHAVLPVIESFGFETDLRSHTQGQAMSLSVFDHWSIVPGDPLDKSIVLRPLEIQPPIALAREFMVKTRRRKGMSEDVRCVTKYHPTRSSAVDFLRDAQKMERSRALQRKQVF